MLGEGSPRLHFMKHHDKWQRLFRVARRSHGVVTLGDARGVGIPKASFFARIRREAWPQLGAGVYLLPGVPLTREALTEALLRCLGEGGALSHDTALQRYDLAPAGGLVHAVQDWDRGVPATPPGTRVHRSRVLDDTDVVVLGRWATTTLARTLADVAASRTEQDLRGLVLSARQRGILDLDDLQRQSRRRRGLRGRARLRRVIDDLDGDESDSLFERLVRELLQEHGLDPTPGPHPVRTPDGQVLHVDIAFPDQHVAIECDGYAHHSGRQAFERDRERWRRLRESAWDILWVTWRRLRDEPMEIVDEVRRALASATWHPARGWSPNRGRAIQRRDDARVVSGVDG